MYVRRHHFRHSTELLAAAPKKIPCNTLEMLTRPIGGITGNRRSGCADWIAMGMLLLAAVFLSWPKTVYADGQSQPAVIYYPISDPEVSEVERSNQPPHQPELITPETGDDAVDLQPEISGTAFFDADRDDLHVRTQWRIETSGNGLLTMDMICQGHNLTGIRVPGFVLDPRISYNLKVRYFDQSDQPSPWSIPVVFSTVADQNDINNNRIPDSQEIDFFTDLNQDGINDADQSSQIISILNYDGNLKLALGIETDSTVIDIQAAANVNPSTLPEPFYTAKEMAYGLLRYKLSVPNPGQEVAVTIYLSDPIDPATPWLRYDSVMGWEDISGDVHINPDGTRISRYVIDGGPGDADGVANGIIIDQCGPLMVEDAAVSSADGTVSDGVEATTCFIQTIGRDVR